MIFDRFKNAWTAFMNKDPTWPESMKYVDYGASSGTNPVRTKMSPGNIKTIFGPIINRVALDVAQISFKHVQLDSSDRFIGEIKDSLNDCLTLSANIDQTHRALFQDAVISMFDEGYVAIAPSVVDHNPYLTESFKIYSLRVAKIVDWYPKYVKLEMYNEDTGLKQQIIMPKHCVVIVENPLYATVNEPNSTLQRLIRTLSMLDEADRNSSGNKLDIIIQLPFAMKGDVRRKQYEERRVEIEDQLKNSPRGIAYIDSQEHVVQLNRPADNQIMDRVEKYTKQLYDQLGLTEEVLNGTADEQTMLNYYNRTIEPICSAIADEMKRKFLSKTAITQGQSVMFFRDPFKLAPVSQIADLGDKFITNEIMTSNEFRQVLGLKPSDSPGADELRNKHLNAPADQAQSEEPNPEEYGYEEYGGENQNGY